MLIVILSILSSPCVGLKYFDATRDPYGVGDNFTFVVNGTYDFMLDTGADVSWLPTDKVRRGGYKVAPNTILVMYHQDADYPFVGHVITEVAARETFVIGNGIKWKQLMPLVERYQDGIKGIKMGILGASLTSDFFKQHPIMTIFPQDDSFRIIVDEAAIFEGTLCVDVPLADSAVDYGRWWLGKTKLTLSTGESFTADIMEVDTGFGTLALPHALWNSMKRRLHLAGARRTRKVGPYSYEYSNCHADSMPSMKYEFENAEGQVLVAPPSFVDFLSGGICVIHVTSHDPKNVAGLTSYIGVPVMRNVVTEFNSKNLYISFCQPPN
jgi:hypothetical protein